MTASLRSSVGEAVAITYVTDATSAAPGSLRDTAETLINAHVHWVIAARPRTDAALQAYRIAKSDTRVSVVEVDDDEAGLIAAFATTQTPYVAVIDPGDLVVAGIDAAVELMLGNRPAIVYTDEQVAGGHRDVFITKPDWSPHLLQGTNYISRLAFMRADLIRATGGWPSIASAEWLLALRLSVGQVVHLPVIGVHRPYVPAVTADEAREVLHTWMTEVKISGAVETIRDDKTTVTRIWRDIPDPHPHVTIIIPTGGGLRTVEGIERPALERCLQSLLSTEYDAWDVVLVPSAGTDQKVVDLAASVLGDRLTVASASGSFNFSASINIGAETARGEYLLLLNDDTEVIDTAWLSRMVSVIQDPLVAVVGAKLYFADDRIQHVGVFLNQNAIPAHMHIFETDDFRHGYAKILDIDLVAVTGACMLVRRDDFVNVGGLDEQLPLNFNDIDFCLKLRFLGRGIVCTPAARLRHYESTTRTPTILDTEEHLMTSRWRPWLDLCPKVDYRGHRVIVDLSSVTP